MVSNLIPPHNFAQLDEIILKHNIVARSLNPQKTICTCFQSLGDQVATNCKDTNITKLIQNTLELTLIAQIQNFPENIFWDFDYIVSYLVEQVNHEEGNAAHFLEQFANKMVSLMDLFGNHHEICFRYVHDFSYGFDWARWIKKQPEQRSQIQPFANIFLDDILHRGKEMIASIIDDENDTYKTCDNNYRNSFNFSREPEDEYRLMTLLASYQLIPIPIWNWDATPVWHKPFDKLREQVSQKIR